MAEIDGDIFAKGERNAQIDKLRRRLGVLYTKKYKLLKEIDDVERNLFEFGVEKPDDSSDDLY